MRFDRFSVVCRSLAVVICWQLAAAALAADAPAQRPNIVVIVVDDFGWTDLACYGSKYYQTPNVDRLAADGMWFTQAYAACPVCSPTRAALMTGKYPARLHLTDYIPGKPNSDEYRLLRADFRQELPLEEVTVAEVLRDAGYTTAAIGKWHMGGRGYEPTRQGFELGVGGNESGSVRGHFAPYLGRQRANLPGLDDAPKGEYLADRLTTEAEKFIEANRARPFFLYLPHYAVHTPIMAPRDEVSRYEAMKPTGLQRNPIYGAMVSNVDHNVGRIVSKLDALGLAANTIVIFTSDNGGLATAESPNTPATNNAPLREGKGYLYEGGIRVPLIVKWPAAIKPATTSEVPTSSIDLLPTLAEICGLTLGHPIDGVSIVSALKQTGPLAREALYWHYPHYSPQGGKQGAAIRQGDYKLIEFFEDGRRELFNLADDIGESQNLVDRQSDRAEQMAASLASWLKAVDAQMPRPNPNFVPDHAGEDGVITLPARTAQLHGVMIRYEPLPHKNTIGYWVRQDDWLSWDLQVDKPGRYQVEILQGCGAGSGGSQVDFAIDGQTLSTTVEETGGFQKFVERKIGEVELSKPGRYTLTVKSRTKPGGAVMDLRQVRLVPTALSK